MKRRFILFFALTTMFGSAMADDGVWVERLNGTKQGFLFAEAPKITYSGNDLVMTTTKATATFPLADVRRVYFHDTPTSIDSQHVADAQSPLIRVGSGGAALSGFSPDAPVEVFDAFGRLISRHKTSADGTLSVSLTAHPTGIYIIKAEKTTLKIQKK